MKWSKNFIPFFFLIIAGCTVSPPYEPPVMDVPCDWNAPIEEGMDSEPCDWFCWWQSFNDSILTELIEAASLQNLDIQIAESRIMQARMMGLGARASLYPRIDATVNYDYARYDHKVVRKLLGNKCRSHHNHLNFFEAGFDAEWEIDLFGKTQYEVKAAIADVGAACENLRDVMVTLSAEVARNYIELRGFQALLELTDKHLAAQKESIELTKSLYQSGFSGIVDQWQAEEELNILQAERPLLQLSIDKSIYRLSILLGYTPGELISILDPCAKVPELPCYKPIGLPSELLRNRPDIRRAERQLAAATERVGSAVADLFPRISLRGFFGEIATQLTNPSFLFFAGPSLLAPIFNSRSLQQDVDLNQYKAQEACLFYQKTVLEALEEVENSLAEFHYELEKHRRIVSALAKGSEVYEQNLQLYQRGLKNYLDVLVAQRSRVLLEESLLKSQVQLLKTYISLYKALGGGWGVVDCCGDDS